MTHFFERRDRWGNGMALWVLAGMLFLVPMAAWSLLSLHMENEVHQWIPRDNPDWKKFEFAQRHFPAEDAILFSWDHSSLDDPRLPRLASRLRGTVDAHGVRYGGSKYIDRIRTPHDLILQMKKDKVPVEDAVNRLTRILIGAGPLRVVLTEMGRTRQQRAIDAIRQAVRRETGIEPVVTVAGDGPDYGTDVAAGESTADEPGEASPDRSMAGAAETDLSPEMALADELPVVPRHDLVVWWQGMHWDPAKVAAAREAILEVHLPVGRQTAPATPPGDQRLGLDRRLVQDCLQVAGSPIGIAIYLTEAGKADRPSAFRWLLQAAEDSGIPAASVHMGGSAVTGTSLNREVMRAVWDREVPVYMLHRRSLVLASSVVGGLLALWLLRSFRLAGLVMGVSLYTTLISTALVPLAGSTMNMVLVVMPTLLLVTTLSIAIHIANYWQHAAAANLATAIGEAMSMARGPVIWAGLTSAIGQASLVTSSLSPVRDFGIYSAIGTLVSLVVALYGLPALLQLWPCRSTPRLEDLDNAFWHGLAAWIARRKHLVNAISLVVSLGCAAGLFFFQTETKVIRYFSENTRAVQDYNFIEGHLTGIIPVDIIVRFDRESQQAMKFLERRQLVKRIQADLQSIRDVSGSLSLSDFLPDAELPSEGASLRARQKFAATSRVIEDRVKSGKNPASRSLLAVADRAGEFNAEGDELWRITAQVAIMSDLNYNDLRVRLDAICQNVLREASGSSFEKVPALGDERGYHPYASHVVTGMIPLFLATQHELLQSFILSFTGAFGSIALVVMLVLRHPVAGLLAMVPNVLPIVAVFGLISWCGLHIDIGSTITASIALGITIDGTLHLITWFRIGIQQGKSRDEAVAQALGHCGPAMWQTTLIVSCGLLMLYPADLILISRFGWLMAALLAAASVSDLVLTPALLAGPLGYLIQRCTSVPAGGATLAPEPELPATVSAEQSGKPHLESRRMKLRRIDS